MLAVHVKGLTGDYARVRGLSPISLYLSTEGHSCLSLQEVEAEEDNVIR